MSSISSPLHDSFRPPFVALEPGHRRQHSATDYTCPYDSEEWTSPVSTLVNNSPEAGYVKEDFEPPEPATSNRQSQRTAITITIPLPWRKSKRASSVPASAERQVAALEVQVAKQDPSPVASTRGLSIDAPPLTPFIASNAIPRPPLSRHRSPTDGPPPTSFNRANNRTTSPVERPGSSASGPDNLASTLSVNTGQIKILSPVNEGFEKVTSSGTTTIDPSPATPVYHHKHGPSYAYSAGIVPQDAHGKEATRYIEFGVPLASHPVLPVEEPSPSLKSRRRATGLGLASTGYMRSQSMMPEARTKPGAARRATSPDRSSRRAASADPHYSSVPPEDTRRDSGSTTYSSFSTTDDDDVPGLDERYYHSRKGWNGSAGGGTNGFYKTVIDDYKLVSRSVGDDVSAPKALTKQKLPDTPFSPTFEVVRDEDSVAPQVLVPQGRELWG